MPDQSFDDFFCDAISEALSDLGDAVKQVICYYLEKSFKLHIQDIPGRKDEFAKAIDELLGPGAEPLEDLIIRKLIERIDVKITLLPESSGECFVDSVKRAAEIYQSRMPAWRGPSA
jgi:hypothetical protein